MNGPEHYKAAEALLSRASFMDSRGRPKDGEGAANLTALAQVHATLALAAVGAGVIVDHYKGDSYLTNAWSDAIGWVVPAEIVEDDEDPADLRAKPAAPVRIADVPDAACGAVSDIGVRCGEPAGHTGHHKGTSTDEHGAPVFSRWSNTEANHG